MSNRLSTPTRLCLVASALLLMVGGATHPETTIDVPFKAHLTHMLGDSAWVPAHLAVLASFALLLTALVAMRRSLPDAARTASTFAIIGTAAVVAETVLHTAAVVDLTNAQTGAGTPVLDAHLALSVVAYPLFGLGIALFAFRLAASWPVGLRVVSALGIAGSLMFGAAAPIVVLSENQDLAPLFKGVILTSVWIFTLGVAGLRAAQTAGASNPQAQPTVTPVANIPMKL